MKMKEIGMKKEKGMRMLDRRMGRVSVVVDLQMAIPSKTVTRTRGRGE